MKALVLILLLPVAVTAQFVNKSVLNISEYPANIATVTRTTVYYEYDGMDTTRTDKRTEEFEYDSKGVCTSYVSQNESGNFYAHSVKTRDDGSTVLHLYVGSETDSIVEKLDNKRNVIRRTVYKENGTVVEDKYSYDNRGNVTMHSLTQGDSTVTQKITITNNGQRQNETEYHRAPGTYKEEMVRSVDYVYNSGGQKIYEVRSDFKGNERVSLDTTEFEYNEQGKLVHKFATFSNGTSDLEMTYTYDAAGNLVNYEEVYSADDYLDSQTEEWKFDSHGYWSAYSQDSFQELGETYTTTYNEQGLPVYSVNLGMGQKNVTTWTYGKR